MGVIKKSEHNTFGHTPNLNDLVNKIYDPDEIKLYYFITVNLNIKKN